MASPAHLTTDADEISLSESSIEFELLMSQKSLSSKPISPIKLRSRMNIFEEKMHKSDSSVEFVWEEDGHSEEPVMKAISMTSLGLEDSCREQQEETRRVRFSADIDCQAYIHILDYSLKESMSCFYTDDERSHMAATRDYIIAKIDRGINEEAEDEFLRGLEYWCQESCRAIDRRVDRSIQLIMDEQDRQIDNNIFDEYTISISAQTVSAKSSKVARKIAREDARMAQEAYFDMAHNGTISGYMMPATLCTFEPTKTKKKTKRGRTSKRRNKVEESVASEAAIADEGLSEEVTRSEELTVPKKVKKEKKKRRNSAPADVILKSSEEKSTKKKKRHSSLSLKRRNRKARSSTSGETDDKSASSSKKSKKSSSSKSSKKSKSSTKKKKKAKRSSKSTATSDDKDTVTTAPNSQETLGINKQEHGSLSSNEDDTFLISTKKKLSIKPPTRRYTLTGPAASIDDSPMLERGFSWWNLKV